MVVTVHLVVVNSCFVSGAVHLSKCPIHNGHCGSHILDTEIYGVIYSAIFTVYAFVVVTWVMTLSKENLVD